MSEVEASLSKQLRSAQERERTAGLSMERRLREEGELAQRLSSRNTDLEVPDKLESLNQVLWTAVVPLVNSSETHFPLRRSVSRVYVYRSLNLLVSPI